MEHTTALERLCRVCGRSIVTKSVKAKYSCSEYEESLKSVYGIDVRKDSPTIHPQYFCHACKNVLHRSKAQGYTHQTIPFNEWSEHVPGGSCCVCRHYSMIQKGGRPKKMKCTPGRPATTSPRYCVQHIEAVAPHPLICPEDVTPHICQDHQIVHLRQLQCPICCDVLQRPIELMECRSLVCMKCCQSPDTNCPCCYGDHLRDFTTARPASSLILSLLGDLCVICEQCKGHVKLSTYHQHVHSGCQSCYASPSSVDDVINRPLSAPLTPVEHRLQTCLAKRSMAISPEENILKIKTRGQVITCTCIKIVAIISNTYQSQPLCFVQVTQPRVTSGNASKRTVRERSQALQDLRERISSEDSTTQFSEVRSCSADVRQKLLEEIRGSGGAFHVTVPVDASLAMKADLNIPWSMLRVMRRYVNIHCNTKLQHLPALQNR